MAAEGANKQVKKKYTLKRLKKKQVGTGDGGKLSSKGLQVVKKND